MSEYEPLLPSDHSHAENTMEVRPKSRYTKLRGQCGEILEHSLFHKVVIGLIAFDAVIVFADLGYSLLSPQCGAPGEHDDPKWIEVFSIMSLVITSIFMLEIPLELWAFGPNWFNPFGSVRYAALHLFDALVIIVTFLLEVILRGKEREFAALLVVLRLWRLIKLAGGVAVGMGDIEEETAKELAETKDALQQTRSELAETQEENARLRQRLRQLDPESATI